MKNIFILTLLFFSTLAISQQSSITWQTDYLKVLQDARTSNKNIIVYFTDNNTTKAIEQFFLSSEFTKNSSKYLYLKLYKAELAPNQGLKNYTKRLSSIYNKEDIFPAVMVMDAFNTEKISLLKSFNLKDRKAFLQELKSL